MHEPYPPFVGAKLDRLAATCQGDCRPARMEPVGAGPHGLRDQLAELNYSLSAIQRQPTARR